MPKRLGLIDVSRFCVHPFCFVSSLWQLHNQFHFTAAIDVNGISTAYADQSTCGCLIRKPAFDDLIVRLHSDKVEAVNEILENLQLLVQHRPTTYRSVALRCAVFMTDCER